MKRTCRVSFWIPREEGHHCHLLLKRKGYVEGWIEPSPDLPNANPRYEQVFAADDPRLTELGSLVRKYARNWTELIDTVYDEADLQEAPLLEFAIRQPLIDGGGPKFGTEYDPATGCPSCSSGAVQTSSLMVPMRQLPGKAQFCATYSGHFLAGKDLAAALRAGNVSGLELRQVRSHPGKKLLPWWQMIATHTMPRLSPRTPGLGHDMRPGWGCPVCERDCYEGAPHLVYVRKSLKISAMPDVTSTWECFQPSVSTNDPEWGTSYGPAEPRLLCKPRVYEIFQKMKIKNAEFVPVSLAD